MNKTAVLQVIALFSLTSLSPLQFVHAQWAKGITPSQLSWEVYLTDPQCRDEGDQPVAGCPIEAIGESIRAAGVEKRLLEWIQNPDYKSAWLAYFSFSNKNVAAALCARTSFDPDFNVQIFIDRAESQLARLEGAINEVDQEMATPGHRRYLEGYQTGCAQRIRPRETARGSGEFGGSGNFLQHAKIVLLSDQRELPRDLKDWSSWLSESQTTAFSSSSANMSSFGTSLHYENWLFFTSPSKHQLAQQNLCAMWAFANTTQTGDEERRQFKAHYANCVAEQPQAELEDDIDFFLVPSVANNKGEGPLNALLAALQKTQQSVRVAIHRLTSSQLLRALVRQAERKKKVEILQDDDTLRVAVEDGGTALDVGSYDVHILRQGVEAGLAYQFMQTNGEISQMFHHKFVLIDQKVLFQGAGNFTAAALNAGGRDGNYEQFYVIRIPEIVAAYAKAWEKLKSLTTQKADHPVGNNPWRCTNSNGSDFTDCP